MKLFTHISLSGFSRVVVPLICVLCGTICEPGQRCEWKLILKYLLLLFVLYKFEDITKKQRKYDLIKCYVESRQDYGLHKRTMEI